jgi:hypothetical protein
MAKGITAEQARHQDFMLELVVPNYEFRSATPEEISQSAVNKIAMVVYKVNGKSMTFEAIISKLLKHNEEYCVPKVVKKELNFAGKNTSQEYVFGVVLTCKKRVLLQKDVFQEFEYEPNEEIYLEQSETKNSWQIGGKNCLTAAVIPCSLFFKHMI